MQNKELCPQIIFIFATTKYIPVDTLRKPHFYKLWTLESIRSWRAYLRSWPYKCSIKHNFMFLCLKILFHVWRACMSGMKGAFTTLTLFHKPNRITGNHWSIHSMIGMEQISTLLDYCLTSELLKIITLNMLFPGRVMVWRSIPFIQPGTLFLLYPTSELLQNHSISPDCSQT